VLEAIRQLGKANPGGFVFGLVNRAPEGRNGEKKHLLAMNFRVAEDRIELSFPELSDRVREEYLWVGNWKGSTPQDRLTTNRSEYLFFDSLLNLASRLKGGEFKDTVTEVVERFFAKAEIGGETVRFLDIRKIQGFPAEPELPQAGDAEKFRSEYIELFFRLLKENYGFSKKDFGLFAAEIDGKKPSELEEYVAYLEQSTVEERFKDYFEGICYVCGRKSHVTWDTASLPDKFYITKLIIFSSGLAGKDKLGGGFAKNFVLCRECYRDLFSGMRYLRNYLNAKLAGNTLYIIPGLFFNPLEKTLTKGWVDHCRDYVFSIFTPEGFLDFRKKVEQDLEDYQNYEQLIDYGYIDLLFYRRKENLNFFKIRRLIREVPLRRVKEIRSALGEIQKLGDELLGESKDKDWLLSLDRMYYLLPVRSGEEIEYRKILDVYEHLFLGYPLDRNFLMRFFLTLAQVYYFKRPGYNVNPGGNPDWGLVRSMLQSQLLLKFFEKLSLIRGGGKAVEADLEILNKEIAQYVKKMGYSEEETALFLLGYLIGEIGANQVRGSDSAKKPILGKINFNGMNAKRLLTLSNEVFEKLDQYNIRKYNEKVFALLKSLLDAHIKNWSLSEAENVYYILSGYAFCTYQIVTRGKKEEEEQ
jgi:CRISPR-associated protein Csh1